MQETAMTFRGSQDAATPPGPQTRFSMTCPFKKPVPRVLEPQPALGHLLQNGSALQPLREHACCQLPAWSLQHSAARTSCTSPLNITGFCYPATRAGARRWETQRGPPGSGGENAWHPQPSPRNARSLPSPFHNLGSGLASLSPRCFLFSRHPCEG